MSGTFARIADLPVRIEGYELQMLSRPTSSGFERTTVLVRMHGLGAVGEGEDVWLVRRELEEQVEAGEVLHLGAVRSVEDACARLGEPDLFPSPSSPVGVGFRRWGYEAAMLDLALRQAGMSLSDALRRPVRPVRYVLSIRLGEPSSPAPLRERLAYDPSLMFKLDPVGDWTADLVDEVADLTRGRVAVLDFKAFSSGAPAEVKADAEVYRRCIAAWPEALIEDPSDAPEIGAVVAGHEDRVSWDAPLHRLTDVTALPRTPRVVNIKPCRFGGLRELMSVYDHCDRAGIAMYGGGFFELGPGRGQLQYLASMFHPDATNDVAPRGFHWPHPGPGIPPSPLPPAPRATGFAWTDPDPPPLDRGSVASRA